VQIYKIIFFTIKCIQTNLIILLNI